MDDEKLIEAVSKYPDIYDASSAKYMDNKYKSYVWNKIGDEVQQTGTLCKSRWQNIRDQFRKNLAKNVTKTGRAFEKRKKYKYEDCLQFIIPYFGVKDTTSTVPSSISEERVESLDGVDETEEIQTQQAPQPPQPKTEIVPSPVMRKQPKPAKRKLQQQEASSSILMQNVTPKYETRQVEGAHPIDAFFLGLAATVKTFSPYAQHIAKGRLFAVVQEMEHEQFNIGNVTPTYSLSMDETSSGSIYADPLGAEQPSTSHNNYFHC